MKCTPCITTQTIQAGVQMKLCEQQFKNVWPHIFYLNPENVHINTNHTISANMM